MSGPPSGKYYIQLARDPKGAAGAVHEGGDTDPVYTGGDDRVWTVTQVQGEPRKYTLFLEQSGTVWFSQVTNERVEVRTLPNTWVWSIQGNGPYTIEVPSPIWPTTAWTVNDPSPPPSLVTLETLTIPLPSQLWDFIPAPQQ